VADGRFSDPDGNEFQRDVVHHPGAVSVVPLLDSGEVVLVRQYRAALDATVLEIPAGKLDVPGEEPEEAAQRELAEEVGYRAGRLDELAQFWNSPGFCDEHSTVYLGRDLAATDRAVQGVEEAHMTMESVALDAIPAMIAAHQLLDAKTIIGCTLALRALEGPAH
jgi:8-oxo-dGTP pyrophosphatase MutT (NUDIX family)